MDGVSDAEIARKIGKIAAAFRLLAARLAREKGGLPEGLTLSERLLLERLSAVDEYSMGALATAVGSPVSVVSRQVDSLVEGRLVDRKRSTDDRRVVIVSITQHGKELLSKLEAEDSERYLYLARLFGQGEARQLRSGLVQILDVILKGLTSD